MNLTKLFEMQKVLRDKIDYNKPDRFNKLVLALLVELGECANEWRGFKFWSEDQVPRTIKEVEPVQLAVVEGIRKVINEGTYTNPLLEEYVDGLHFVLEIGLEIAEEIQFDVEDYFKEINDEIRGGSQKNKDTTEQFSYIFYLTTIVGYDFNYPYLYAAYYHLGEMLGFTWEQIEQAYIEKNKVNHQRQESGY